MTVTRGVFICLSGLITITWPLTRIQPRVLNHNYESEPVTTSGCARARFVFITINKRVAQWLWWRTICCGSWLKGKGQWPLQDKYLLKSNVLVYLVFQLFKIWIKSDSSSAWKFEIFGLSSNCWQPRINFLILKQPNHAILQKENFNRSFPTIPQGGGFVIYRISPRKKVHSKSD